MSGEKRKHSVPSDFYEKQASLTLEFLNSLWTRIGFKENPIGHTVSIDGKSYTIVDIHERNRKNPVIVKNSQGTSYKISVETTLKCMEKRRKTAETAHTNPVPLFTVFQSPRSPQLPQSAKPSIPLLLGQRNLFVAEAFTNFKKSVAPRLGDHSVVFKWNSRLSSTAGRAHADFDELSGISPLKITIDLSTQLLTTQSRITLTVVHELCHAAVFVYHGKKASAHGREFKQWGAKALAAMGVKVSRCHNYRDNHN